MIGSGQQEIPNDFYLDTLVPYGRSLNQGLPCKLYGAEQIVYAHVVMFQGLFRKS